MNTTREFNLQNWTGETATVQYTDDGRFSFYGYQFQVGELDREDEDIGLVCAELNGEGWIHPLTTIIRDDADFENFIIAAVRYVANHV